MVIATDLVKEFTKTEKVKKKNVKTTFRAVDGISIEAKDGETLGILGPNGAGKTTLLRMLGTLMEPTSGTVKHITPEGGELTKPEDIKAKMGYLSNNTKLYEKFSVREFLSMLGELYDIDKEETKERIENVIKTLGMESFADNRVKALSTGQTQRVSIARCLFANPDLYILDEPTTGLHIADVHRLVDILQRLVDTGNTIIVIEHNLDLIKTCDHIIDLGPEGGDGGGQVVAVGTPEQICKNEQSYTGKFLKKYLE